VPFEFLNRRVYVPDPTRTLLHTVIHGIRYNPEPSIRWIADAMWILHTSASNIDWNFVIEFARRLKLAHRLHLGLDYLTRDFNAPVPGNVLARVAGRQQSPVERIEAFCHSF
jgi:hypothetical protein